jgi:hypothetical protein
MNNRMLRDYNNNNSSNNNMNLLNKTGIYDDKERITKINQQMMRLKHLQQMKQLEKFDDIDKIMNKDKRRDAIIEPIKVDKPKDNGINMANIARNKENTEYNKKFVEEQFWRSRTNQPYKSALKDVLPDKEYYKKNFTKTAELIVHKTTAADKEYLMDDYNEFEKLLEKQNSQLKMTYSASKESEHKKQFKYNHKTKFKIKYDPADFKNLKQNKMDYYKNEQIKLNQDKKNVEDLIDSALNNTILNDSEIKSYYNKSNNKLKDLENELISDLGDGAKDIIHEAVKQPETKKVSNFNSVIYVSDNDGSNGDNSSDSDSENITKPSVITIDGENTKADKSKYAARKAIDVNKYKLRKKQ